MSPNRADDDAVELAEMLEFLHDWVASAAPELAPSLDRFTGGGYPLSQLRADLARFAFLAGGDGERLFGSRP